MGRRATDLRWRACLTDDEVLQLAQWALQIEDHYARARGTDSPMDIEWGKDGQTGELLSILHDILARARLDNRERFQQLVLEEKAAVESRLVPAGSRPAFLNSRNTCAWPKADWSRAKQVRNN